MTAQTPGARIERDAWPGRGTVDAMTAGMIAEALRDYLEAQRARYHVRSHQPRATASQIARAAHVPGEHFAKAVLVRVHDRPPGRIVLVVVPSDKEVDLPVLHSHLGFPVELADEDQQRNYFPTFEPGAIPPMGELAIQHLPVFVDASLSGADEIAFNGGTFTDVVEMPWSEYARVVQHKIVECGCPRGRQARDGRTSG